MNQLFGGLFYHSTAQACLVDLTPPTFAGIASLVANANGSLTAGWLAATDASAPIEYEIYIQANSATGLFSSGNLVQITKSLSVILFVTPDLIGLQAGVPYYVGVRAKDSVGNLNTNTVSLSAVSQGVLESTGLELAQAVLSLLRSTAVPIKAKFVDPDKVQGVFFSPKVIKAQFLDDED